MSDTGTHGEFLFEGDLLKLGWTSPTWTKRYFEVSKRGIVTYEARRPRARSFAHPAAASWYDPDSKKAKGRIFLRPQAYLSESCGVVDAIAVYTPKRILYLRSPAAEDGKEVLGRFTEAVRQLLPTNVRPPKSGMLTKRSRERFTSFSWREVRSPPRAPPPCAPSRCPPACRGDAFPVLRCGAAPRRLALRAAGRAALVPACHLTRPSRRPTALLRRVRRHHPVLRERGQAVQGLHVPPGRLHLAGQDRRESRPLPRDHRRPHRVHRHVRSPRMPHGGPGSPWTALPMRACLRCALLDQRGPLTSTPRPRQPSPDAHRHGRLVCVYSGPHSVRRIHHPPL